MVVTRPAMTRAAVIAQGMPDAAPADRERLIAEMNALRRRGGVAGLIVAALVVAAAAAMAVGRYV